MKKQYIYVALATILFSTMEIALKYIAGEFNPIQLTFARFFVGGLVLLPFAWSQLKKHGDKLTKKVVAHFALLGFLGVFISMTFYQLAVFNTKASVVAVLFSRTPYLCCCSPICCCVSLSQSIRWPLWRWISWVF